MSKKALPSSKPIFSDYIKAIKVVLLAYVLIFGCCFFAYVVITLPCRNDVIDEVYSPDNQFKVVVFRSGCGPNSTDFINAAILKADQKLSNSEIDLFRVKIFISDIRDIGEIHAVWEDNRSIQVIYSYSMKKLVQKREFNYSNQIFTVYYKEKTK